MQYAQAVKKTIKQQKKLLTALYMVNPKGISYRNGQAFTHGPHIKMACWYVINHQNISL